jgi:hypothetical protein
MASRASSEPVVPALPGLGTTWYARGGRYWTRRVLSAVVLLALMAGLDAAAVELYSGFLTVVSRPVRQAWDAAQIVLACLGAVGGWVLARRQTRRQVAEAADGAEVRRTGGAVLGGRFVLVLLSPVAPALAALATGWLASSLTVREYPTEVAARRALDAAGQRRASVHHR